MASDRHSISSKSGPRMHANAGKSNRGSQSGDDTDQQKKGSILGKFNARFQEALQHSRGEEATREPEPVREPIASPRTSIDDLAVKQARTVSTDRMVLPEGVVIEGSMTSRSETLIGGKIEGDVMVEAGFRLTATGTIHGNVRALHCMIDGQLTGDVDSTADLQIGPKGNLLGDLVCGRGVVIAGKVKGNVTCNGQLHLKATADLNGNIRARSLVVEEGAIFNGACTMSRQKASEPAAPQPAQPATANK